MPNNPPLFSQPYVSINKVIVPHDSFSSALKKINQIYKHSHNRQAPSGLTLTGESGTGKTSLLEQFTSMYPPTITPEGLNKPVMMITVPAVPYVRVLAGKILEGLGDPAVNFRASEEERTRRAIKLTRECGVRAVIFEEFQHFIERGDKRVIAASDWLKVYIDETKVMAVISGLESSRQILYKNEQLARRFSSNLKLPRFEWLNRDLRYQFQGILESFKKSIEGISLPDLSSDQVAFRFYLGTGGLISNIAKLLEQALWNAEEEQRREITIEDLALAWEETLSQPHYRDFNPFKLKAKFDFQSSLPPDLIAFAQSVGAPQSTIRINPAKDQS